VGLRLRRPTAGRPPARARPRRSGELGPRRDDGMVNADADYQSAGGRPELAPAGSRANYRRANRICSAWSVSRTSTPSAMACRTAQEALTTDAPESIPTALIMGTAPRLFT
jgi:hypothetical protein